MRRLILLISSAAVSIAGAGLLSAGPAHGTFPGANGKIAFQSDRDGNTEVYVMNADGTGQTNVSDNPARDDAPAWSPDGTKIAFSSSRDDPYPTVCSPCNFEIYVMNADGTGQTRLTNSPGMDTGAAWSPGGTKLAFISDRDGNNEIYVMNADGTGQTNLTNHAAYDAAPDWAPGGTKIAFDSQRDGNVEVYTMNSDGSSPQRLTTDPAFDGDPTWSPDGTRIAFGSSRAANAEVFVMNADGSGQTMLTGDPSFGEGSPEWSPDGAKIAFVSVRDSISSINAEIYSMNADGSAQTRLTNNPALDAQPSWQSLPLPPAVTPTVPPAVGGLSGDAEVRGGASGTGLWLLASGGATVLFVIGGASWYARRRVPSR